MFCYHEVVKEHNLRKKLPSSFAQLLTSDEMFP